VLSLLLFLPQAATTPSTEMQRNKELLDGNRDEFIRSPYNKHRNVLPLHHIQCVMMLLQSLPNTNCREYKFCLVYS
jgi:hypothetical protein